MVHHLVGKKDVVVHTADQEGGKGNHKEELPGEEGPQSKSQRGIREIVWEKGRVWKQQNKIGEQPVGTQGGWRTSSGLSAAQPQGP